MDIGTGKDIEKKSKIKNQKSKLRIKNQKYTVGYRLKEGIPVWMVDVVRPDQEFNVHDYQTLAEIVISDIEKRGKLPIIVGGTGLYIKALTEYSINIDVPPDPDLRRELSLMSVGQLQEKLINLDKARFDRMNHSDKLNPRRLIRSIEIVSFGIKNHFNTVKYLSKKISADTDALKIGLSADINFLFKQIDRRVEKRLKEGITLEIQKLLKSGYGWDLPSMSGLGYRQFRDYTDGKGKLDDAIVKWKLEEKKYMKRQMTWFKADKRINWFNISLNNFKAEIDEIVRKWYTN